MARSVRSISAAATSNWTTFAFCAGWARPDVHDTRTGDAVNATAAAPFGSLKIVPSFQDLEDQLGQELFDRSSNPGTLTEAGTVLKDYAERLIRLADEAETSL